MLKLANNYVQQINDLFQEMVLDTNYYGWYSVENYQTLIYKPQENTWQSLDMVSIDSKGNLCGFFSAKFHRPLGYISNLSIVHKKGTPDFTFAKDFRKFFFDLFRVYGVPKIVWSVNCGNPAEEIYDKFISHHISHAHIIGIFPDHEVTITNQICDSKVYQFMNRRRTEW